MPNDPSRTGPAGARQVTTISTIAYTIALCTHNHAGRLRRTLLDLSRLTAPLEPWELLIVDNGSTDGTAALLSGHCFPPDWNVRIVREDKLGLSNARNRAIGEAVGEYLIFIDDDETPDPDWLCAYERGIREWRPDALGGRIAVLFEDDFRPEWLTDELLGFLGQLDRGSSPCVLADPTSPFYGGNFAFRRTVFDRIGRFDAELGRKGTDNTGGEDTEIFRRLLREGCIVRWLPDAIIHHRIQAAKLHRRYFRDLHYRQGRMEGRSKRDGRSRLPPAYLYGQLMRALRSALVQRLTRGPNASLRKEMNVTYFLGFLRGWAFGK